jgi:hypothetical protein
MFDITGMCLFLMVVWAVMNFGHNFIWTSIDPAIGWRLWDLGNVCCFIGVMGFIRLRIDSAKNEIEFIEQTHGRLRIAMHMSARVRECYSTARWLRRVLADDCFPEDLETWIGNIEADPYNRNLKFFMAVLNHDTEYVTQVRCSASGTAGEV